MTMYTDLELIIDELKIGNPDFRITAQRKIIIKAILSMEGHFSADQVMIEISNLYPELVGISKATVYGTLDILVKNGILTIINGRSFKNNSYYDRRIDPHINLICIFCGKIEDVEEIPLENVLNQLNNLNSWELVQQTIGLQGICNICKK